MNVPQLPVRLVDFAPMRLLERMWRPSPLLSSVPLNGTDTVTGLRELERSTRLRHKLRPHADHVQHAQRRRYQGPHVWELPVDALQAPAVSWERFLHGGRLRHAYSIPASTDMLVDRLDQNVVTYLANYLRVSAILLGIAGYMNPRAACGVIMLGLIAAANLSLRQTQASTDILAAAGNASVVAMLLVTIWSGCIAVLLRWVARVLLVAVLHGSLRAAQAEAAPGAQQGVSFLQVLGFRPHPDPRRVFRELWHMASTAVCDAAEAAATWCRQQMHLAMGPYLQRTPVQEAYVS